MLFKDEVGGTRVRLVGGNPMAEINGTFGTAHKKKPKEKDRLDFGPASHNARPHPCGAGNAPRLALRAPSIHAAHGRRRQKRYS